MLTREDGSKSQRGLWDNIRDNKGSGKKPTKEMKEQAMKIQKKDKKAGSKFAESSSEMLKGQLMAIQQHAEKLYSMIDVEEDFADWIGAQVARAESDLGDIANYVQSHEHEKHEDFEITNPAAQRLLASVVDAGMIIEKLAAEYQGRDVELNKPTKGDRKQHKVYVKNDKGNVVKVEFGDPDMENRSDDPERRKAFRARHNCDDPGPKWKARYWSCKMW